MQADDILEISPPWLKNMPAQGAIQASDLTDGRYMWVLGFQSDKILEKINQGMFAHVPNYAPVSALPFIGYECQIDQGPGESTASYRKRLNQSFDMWAYAGSSRAVLQNVSAYLSGFNGTFTQTIPICATVGGYNAAKWCWFNNTDNPALPPSMFTVPSGNWVWDGLEATRTWREWLVLYFQRSAAVLSGTAASITTRSGNFATVTGLSGLTSTFTSETLPAYITFSGCASAANNGTWQCTAYVSGTSAKVAMPAGVASDANNGSISWAISYFPGLQPTPVFGFPGDTWGGNTNQAWGVQSPGTANTVDVPGYFTGLRKIVQKFKCSRSWYVRIICRFTSGDLTPGTEFSPWSSAGSGNPNGGWGSAGKSVGNVWINARLTGVQFGAFDAYCAGTVGVNGAPVNFGGV